MSNLIKVSQYVPVEVLKQLNLARTYDVPEEQRSDEEDQQQVEVIHGPSAEDLAAEEMRNQMLSDAKDFAETQIRTASEQAERMLEEARAEIERWWVERREQDEHLVEAVKSEAFNEGYEEGKQRALEELQDEITERMNEASAVLEQAYVEKQEIILEAEPFLVELSSAIAEKVIDKQLELNPDYTIDLIKKSLSRKKEQGTLTLCVSPAQFSFVQAAREELSLVIDSQAELQILPDPAVHDKGCVIRSSFGSVDAKIDTQLKEIKKELLRISRQSDEWSNGDGEYESR